MPDDFLVRILGTQELDPPDFLTKIFGAQEAGPDFDVRYVLTRMVVAGALGAVVAGVYRFSCRHRIGAPGLPSTIILLAMLITMVTLSIGDNAAKAFTLVGTLAIVRFRTPVRDIRDTAFVIFAVAVGIALGVPGLTSVYVAAGGVVVVGAVAALLSAKRPEVGDVDLTAPDVARVDLRVDSAQAVQDLVEPLLERLTRSHRVIQARTTNDGLRMLYGVTLRDPKEVTSLVDALHALDPVRRVTVSFEQVDSTPASSPT